MRSTSSNIASLHIVSINVCGLPSKLSCTEFTDFISNYDIVCIDKTKANNTDNIVLAGFEAFTKHRCELSRFKSGGTSIFVKDDLVNKVKIIDSPNKSCIWMKGKLYTNNQYKKILLGAVYVPQKIPSMYQTMFSKYSKKNIFGFHMIVNTVYSFEFAQSYFRPKQV